MSSGAINYDWTKTEPQILVDMLKADNKAVNLDEEMLSFGVPEAINLINGQTHNTKVLVTATPLAPFYGSQYHYYHRVDINEFVFPGITNLIFYIYEQGDKESLAAEINRRLGINISADKLDIEIPTSPTEEVDLIIKDSLCYMGELKLRYDFYVPELPHVIKKVDLDGFFY